MSRVLVCDLRWGKKQKKNSGLRPPANYLEYIEAEQEQLPTHSRQEFTIFSSPPCPDGNHPWADRHGVEG
eukprot:3769354-Prymnesium_polylepis.1